MKPDNNTKKQKEMIWIDNHLLKLIKRYDGVEEWYIREINKYLLETYLFQFPKSVISKIVNNKARITPKTIIIKEAAEQVVSRWGRKIGALHETETLVSDAKGIRVLKRIVTQQATA